MTASFRLSALAALAMSATLQSMSPAAAHPHVWVNVETAVLYDKGRVSGLRHKWTFDELYTTMAIQGLDTNNDGVFDRKELAELAQVNIDGLKEFDYFTFAKLGATELKLGAPVDYWLEHKDGVLSLHFSLPMAEPVLAEATGFAFQVFDPSFFIAFDLAKDTSVSLAEGAPQGCKAVIGVPEKDAADLKNLNESFFSQLGGNAAPGISVAKTVTISCTKS